MTTVLLASVCGVLGLAVGSFLNVVIHRVPNRQSVSRPRSHCPRCATTLANRDNIPVASWLLLRGRCRTCGTSISVRYPLVEVATAALFVAVAVRFGLDPALPAFFVLAAAVLAISVIDLEHYIVPNRIVFPALLITASLLAVAALVEADGNRLVIALLGALLASAALFAVHLISPRGMGMGDVKLMLLLGLHLGWLSLGHVALGLFLGFVFGSVAGLALIALGRRKRSGHIPFAPFLVAGALVVIFVGEPVLDAYLRMGST